MKKLYLEGKTKTNPYEIAINNEFAQASTYK